MYVDDKVAQHLTTVGSDQYWWAAANIVQFRPNSSRLHVVYGSHKNFNLLLWGSSRLYFQIVFLVYCCIFRWNFASFNSSSAAILGTKNVFWSALPKYNSLRRYTTLYFAVKNVNILHYSIVVSFCRCKICNLRCHAQLLLNLNWCFRYF